MYDSIIIGAGPAGMTAAIYLARANKKVLIIEKETIGGQISSSPLVENYPGYEGISGSVLANNMYNQVDKLGVDIELDEVTDIIPGELHTVKTLDNEFKTRTVIIATGVKYRLLGLENEIELIGMVFIFVFRVMVHFLNANMLLLLVVVIQELLMLLL